jgi:hypothetical protein
MSRTAFGFVFTVVWLTGATALQDIHDRLKEISKTLAKLEQRGTGPHAS